MAWLNMDVLSAECLKEIGEWAEELEEEEIDEILTEMGERNERGKTVQGCNQSEGRGVVCQRPRPLHSEHGRKVGTKARQDQEVEERVGQKIFVNRFDNFNVKFR